MNRITHTLIAMSLWTAASGCRTERPPVLAPPAEAPTNRAPRAKETQTPGTQQVGVLSSDLGIPVGERAPDALLHDADGQAVQLRDLVANGPTLLVFYRGGWCPYCNFQVHELTRAFSDFQQRGVTPVVVSVDRAAEAAKTQASYTIPFPVLSDPDLTAHRAFRVVHRADEAEIARLKSFGHDIEAASGRDHHEFAVPSIFVIDAGGVVRWAHADPDYRTRPSVAQLLAAIDSLGLAARAGSK